MDTVVNQANNNLESLISQTSKNEFDLTKVLNTEDASPIQDTLLSSNKLIDQVNQTQTKKNVFTIGSTNEPIKSLSGQGSTNALLSKTKQPALLPEHKELKQSLVEKTKQEISLAQSLHNTKFSHSTTPNIKSEQMLSNSPNKVSNVIRTSDSIDPIKLTSLHFLQSPMSKELKQSAKEGYKNGNLLDKFNFNDCVNHITNIPNTIETRIVQKTKMYNNVKNTEPIDPISIKFNNGEFGISVLRKHKQQNTNANQDSILQQISKWIAQKINREVDCILNLFKLHGISDMNFGIDLLARLKNISIFCDSGIAKKLGINGELTKIVGAANDIEEIFAITKDAGFTINESTKTALHSLYKSTRIFEQLDLLDKITKYSASYNDKDIFEDLINNSEDTKIMFGNISVTTRGQLMEYVKDKGSYNTTTSFIDTWGKHNIHRYKNTIVKSYNNALEFDADSFDSDKAKYQIDMGQYFSPMFEEEPFETSCIEENNFQNITPLSLNKVKEVSTFGNQELIPDNIKDTALLISAIPIA